MSESKESPSEATCAECGTVWRSVVVHEDPKKQQQAAIRFAEERALLPDVSSCRACPTCGGPKASLQPAEKSEVTDL